MQELRQTYQGLLLILRHFIAQDEERENHCFRVSIYATRIATFMGLEKDDIEDIRSAALLHDLGQLKISRSILHKAASLVRNEPVPVGDTSNDHLLSGPMGRILPMLLGDKTEGEVRAGFEETNIPMGARILAVADAYDTLTIGNASQPGLSPETAKDTIVAASGTSYDPEVVKAFTAAFNRLEMELPSIIL
jgi:HD-GYP domain-containing protein (c-di-GMP phosphodiesterase class II)